MAHAIDATAIWFGYRRGEAVIRAWTGSVDPGEVVAIVGASGTGKSTLLYLLGAFVRPWAGSLRVHGLDVATLGDRERSDLRAAAIGFVFQDALLDPRRSVLDNIVEGAVYRGDDHRAVTVRALTLLERFSVAVRPRQRATDLSGGQAQRIALCRALLDSPAIVLADEPTGNLDRVNADAVEEALHAHARAGAAVVIATHDEEMASRCDRTFRL